uniref:Uncharacterized 15.6 kDa protein in rps12-trnP intergenic region n=1 Tax=Euglena longa TaxID=3037 RepID=YCX2_EUGLO|nr:hypothetical protein AsloCp14 [Euglena longa]Q31673.2 RecName: Full=Uncharacterized 15.6 kDa protein in rps12-trnP intergenic region; AltName: Full=ORF125a [Euglena longa]CAC24585.1 hypothetical protein [Euglena longa]
MINFGMDIQILLSIIHKFYKIIFTPVNLSLFFCFLVLYMIYSYVKDKKSKRYFDYRVNLYIVIGFWTRFGIRFGIRFLIFILKYIFYFIFDILCYIYWFIFSIFLSLIFNIFIYVKIILLYIVFN